MNKWFLFLLMPLLIAGCQQQPSHPDKEKSVLVSIAPYAFFVDQIAGKSISVDTLIPEGANPHIYEPKPKEVGKVRGAALWIRLGESFDQKVFKVLQEQNPDMKIVDITQGIHLLSACEAENDLQHSHCDHGAQDEGKDLHIWLSPRLAKVQAQTIAQALSHTFPENQALYEKNLAAFNLKLDEVDQTISKMLDPFKGEAILVSHPAFAYFCKDYNLIQLSVEMEGKEPLPQQITQLLQEAQNYKVATVILEPQYSNKGAELIAEQLHVPTVVIDPYTEDYLDNLLHIADIIAKSKQIE